MRDLTVDALDQGSEVSELVSLAILIGFELSCCLSVLGHMGHEDHVTDVCLAHLCPQNQTLLVICIGHRW